MLSDRESTYDWERDGEPVLYAISNAAVIDEEPAQDILTILEERHSSFDSDAMGEETEFFSDSRYEEKSTTDEAWQEAWSDFERSLKSEARFFSRTAADYLTNVFRGIEGMTATDGRSLVIDGGPGTELTAVFQARAFQSDDKLIAALCRPDQQLGSPPVALAATRKTSSTIGVVMASIGTVPSLGKTSRSRLRLTVAACPFVQVAAWLSIQSWASHRNVAPARTVWAAARWRLSIDGSTPDRSCRAASSRSTRACAKVMSG